MAGSYGAPAALSSAGEAVLRYLHRGSRCSPEPSCNFLNTIAHFGIGVRRNRTPYAPHRRGHPSWFSAVRARSIGGPVTFCLLLAFGERPTEPAARRQGIVAKHMVQYMQRPRCGRKTGQAPCETRPPLSPLPPVGGRVSHTFTASIDPAFLVLFLAKSRNGV